jgi:hypothetical protein
MLRRVAMPFAGAWSDGEPSRLRGPPVAVSFAKGKASACLRGGKFPGAFREGEFPYYRGEATSFVDLR